MSERFVSRYDAERFWKRVDIKSPDECWLWTGSPDLAGYGSFSLYGRHRRAHQVAWEIDNGIAFPKGKYGCHSCDNPPCVNPKHIWPGTQLENMRDAQAKRRLKNPPRNTYNSDKTECKRGHPLIGGNLIINTRGSRSCAECLRMHRQNWAERNPDRQIDPVKNRDRARQWRIDNPDKAKENASKQREKNREKIKEYLREYYKANKEKMNEKSRLNHQKRRDEKAALVAAGVVKPTGQTVRSGFVDVPVCELQPPFREPSQVDKLDERSSGRGNGRAR